MIRSTFEVQLDGGEPFRVVVDGRDVRRWEAAHGESWFASASTYSQLTWLAWSAATRQALTDKPWEEFDAECVALTKVGDEPARPTPPVPTAEPSSLSPSGPGSPSPPGRKARKPTS